MPDIETSDYDTIHVENLVLHCRVGPADHWGRPEALQPVHISAWIRLRNSVTQAGERDAIEGEGVTTVNYGTLCRQITSKVEQAQPFRDVAHLADLLSEQCLSVSTDGIHDCRLVVKRPRALLHADFVGIEVTRRPGLHPSVQAKDDRWFIENLRLSTIIGINPPERKEKQLVVTNVSWWSSLVKVDPTLPHPDVLGLPVSNLVASSSYLTVEALAVAIAKLSFTYADLSSPLTKVRVKVSKPSALTFAEGAGVEITRTEGAP